MSTTHISSKSLKLRTYIVNNLAKCLKIWVDTSVIFNFLANLRAGAQIFLKQLSPKV